MPNAPFRRIDQWEAEKPRKKLSQFSTHPLLAARRAV
jgi:hypothetical protein